MNLSSAMLELAIHARERDEITDKRLQKALEEIEHRAARLRDVARRRELSRGQECARCGRRSRAGLLCLPCLGAAPTHVRQAFARAMGLDGMRKATQLVLSYARGAAREEAA